MSESVWIKEWKVICDLLVISDSYYKMKPSLNDGGQTSFSYFWKLIYVIFYYFQICTLVWDINFPISPKMKLNWNLTNTSALWPFLFLFLPRTFIFGNVEQYALSTYGATFYQNLIKTVRNGLDKFGILCFCFMAGTPNFDLYKKKKLFLQSFD